MIGFTGFLICLFFLDLVVFFNKKKSCLKIMKNFDLNIGMCCFVFTIMIYNIVKELCWFSLIIKLCFSGCIPSGKTWHWSWVHRRMWSSWYFGADIHVPDLKSGGPLLQVHSLDYKIRLLKPCTGCSELWTHAGRFW